MASVYANVSVLFKHSLLDREHRADLLLRLQFDQIDDRLALAGSRSFRNLIDVQPVHDAAVREEQDDVVTVRIEQMLHMILFLGLHADDPDSAAVLRLIRIRRHPLDIAGARYGDHAGVARNQIRHVNISFIEGDLCPAGIRVLVLDLLELLLDDADAQLAGGQK